MSSPEHRIHFSLQTRTNLNTFTYTTRWNQNLLSISVRSHVTDSLHTKLFLWILNHIKCFLLIITSFQLLHLWLSDEREESSQNNFLEPSKFQEPFALLLRNHWDESWDRHQTSDISKAARISLYVSFRLSGLNHFHDKNPATIKILIANLRSQTAKC